MQVQSAKENEKSLPPAFFSSSFGWIFHCDYNKLVIAIEYNDDDVVVVTL